MSADADDRAECRPCRGTGQVVSTLGGTPSQVTCPWCEGRGRFLPDHDAQAAAPDVGTPPG
jgi:DnaJ-class molecular chaperone